MLTVRDAVSAAGREGKANEDGFGARGRFAWIIDGATGLGDESLLDAPSDAAWLTAVMNEVFAAEADAASGPMALLEHAAVVAETRFAAERRRAPAERYEVPTAAVLMAEFRPGEVVIAEIGDCAVYFQAGAGAVARFGGTEEGRALEQANARKLMASGGGRTADVLAFLRAVRNKANTPEGYQIFGPERGSAAGVRLHTHRWHGDGEALLLTDGFEAAVEDYALYDPPGLMRAARDGLKGPLEALRAIEKADPECKRYPRFKPSDDATALLVRFEPVQLAADTERS